MCQRAIHKLFWIDLNLINYVNTKLTHCGQVTTCGIIDQGHKCNSLVPVSHQTVCWTNTDFLSVGTLGWNFNVVLEKNKPLPFNGTPSLSFQELVEKNK